MATILLDSTSPAAVIASIKNRVLYRGMETRAAAAYKDGAFAWPDTDRATLRAMGIAVVNISVAGAGAEVYDVETGDWDPASAAAQAGADARNGLWPVLYCNRSTKGQLIADLAGEGLGPGLPKGRGFGLWVATLDGTFTDLSGSDLRSEPGVVAVQYAQADSPVHQAGAPPDLDLSVVTAAGGTWLQISPWQDGLLAQLEQLQVDLSDAITLLKGNL